MKFKILLFLSVISIFISLNSCLKKGEEDPLLSLRSRKARLEGDWKATYYYYKNAQTDSTGSTWLYEFWADEKTYNWRITNPGGGGGFLGNGEFRMKWSFTKDGTYTETLSTDGNDGLHEGTWNFTGGIGDIKNRSQISLFEKNYTASTGLVYGHEGNYVHDTYDLVELKSKKIHLTTTVKQTWPEGEIRIDEYAYDIVLEQEKK